MTRPQHDDSHAPRQEITREDLAGTARLITETPGTEALHVIYARNDHARRLIAGCTSAMPAAPGLRDQVDRALADVPALGAVIARLAAQLAGTRMDRANLLAAARAAVAAQADGETDPLYYLRDELQARRERAAGHGE